MSLTSLIDVGTRAAWTLVNSQYQNKIRFCLNKVAAIFSTVFQKASETSQVMQQWKFGVEKEKAVTFSCSAGDDVKQMLLKQLSSNKSKHYEKIEFNECTSCRFRKSVLLVLETVLDEGKAVQ